jgi:hypothetical protein
MMSAKTATELAATKPPAISIAKLALIALDTIQFLLSAFRHPLVRNERGNPSAQSIRHHQEM